MDSAALRDLFRAEVRDQVAPYLWADTEVYAFMDDAQKMFCRLGGGIADASSPITQRAVPANAAFITISPLILKIRAIQRLSDYRDVEILNFEDVPRLDGRTGEIESVVVGMEPNKLRIVPIPTVGVTLGLVVYRLPLEEITGPGQDFEIDEQHHRHLLHWMKHLAHQKQDAETYDRGRSDTFRAEFLAYCDQAKSERERREHKYRTIAYGGL